MSFPSRTRSSFERGNLKDQLAFGYGIHYCVGAPLAQGWKWRFLLETLTRELPGMRLVDGQADRVHAQYLLSAGPSRFKSLGKAQS